MMTNVAQNEQQQKTTVKSVVESEPKKNVISSFCHVQDFSNKLENIFFKYRL